MVDKIKQNLGSVRAMGLLLGPAFIAAIAYVDPGNFATNMSAGIRYGYLLLWVLIVANLMASLVQYLSAKVGLVTGRSLPEVIRDRLGQKSRITYWLQAELVALATDIAEVLGGALALNILFGLPLLIGGLVTSIVSLFLLAIQNKHGQQIFERVIIGLLLIIPIGFVLGLFLRPSDVAQVLHGLIPRFDGSRSILLATGMLGATVMPHVVYLHSALTRDRHGKQADKRIKALLRATRFDVGAAMLIAGGVNIAMLMFAASSLHGVAMSSDLTNIFRSLQLHVSSLVATLFGVSLLISGLASTSVGCYAGAVIMDDLLHKKVSLLLRRSLTLLPALVLLAVGFNPTNALVLSQVALSFGIPFAVIPLIIVTSKKSIMGKFRNSWPIILLSWLVAITVIVLNLVLIWLTIT